MIPLIKGMLARHGGRSIFDNPYIPIDKGYDGVAQEWKRGYYKAGRTPYRQLIPAIKIGVPVMAILWLIASFGLSSPEVDTSNKACLAEEATPYYEPFGLVHPDFPERMVLDKGGMPVEAEDAFIPEYEPEHVEEFFDEETPLFSDGLRKTEHPNIEAPAPRFQGRVPEGSGRSEAWKSEECAAVIASPGVIPLVLIGSLYFVGRLV